MFSYYDCAKHKWKLYKNKWLEKITGCPICYIENLNSKVQFLVDFIASRDSTYGDNSQDVFAQKGFTFPDGEFWPVTDKENASISKT